MQQVSFTAELFRKLIHVSSLIIPVFYYTTDEITMLVILVPVTIVVFILDASKNYVKEIGELVNKIFGSIMREKEFKGLSGATYTLLASCICIALFPKTIAITALAVPAVADAAAGLVGRRYGKMKFFSKSVEGTLSFIASGTLMVYIIMLIFQLNLLFFVTGFVAVCISSVIEASSKYLHIDDNFSLPLVMGLSMGVLL